MDKLNTKPLLYVDYTGSIIPEDSGESAGSIIDNQDNLVTTSPKKEVSLTLLMSPPNKDFNNFDLPKT